jgi:hypothetical protein
MRLVSRIVLAAALALAVAGCSRRFPGPTVGAFTGRVTYNGQPVSFPEGEKASLKVFHEKGQSFGIPLKPDGSFRVGWMPVGKYSVLLNRDPKDGRGAPVRYNVPDGLTIKEGQTEYSIELGKARKP